MQKNDAIAHIEQRIEDDFERHKEIRNFDEILSKAIENAQDVEEDMRELIRFLGVKFSGKLEKATAKMILAQVRGRNVKFFDDETVLKFEKIADERNWIVHAYHNELEKAYKKPPEGSDIDIRSQSMGLKFVDFDLRARIHKRLVAAKHFMYDAMDYLDNCMDGQNRENIISGTTLEEFQYILTKYNMSTVVIVHGSFASKDCNWFPWLKGALGEGTVIAPQFPFGVGKQAFGSWEKLLASLPVDENTVFIGHSIGAVFLCKFLLKNKASVNKCILISGFNNFYSRNIDYDAVNESFFVNENILPEIKKLVGKIICIYGDDDPYLPKELLEDFANAVTNKNDIEVIKGGGHINSESGYTKLPQILKYL